MLSLPVTWLSAGRLLIQKEAHLQNLNSGGVQRPGVRGELMPPCIYGSAIYLDNVIYEKGYPKIEYLGKCDIVELIQR